MKVVEVVVVDVVAVCRFIPNFLSVCDWVGTVQTSNVNVAVHSGQMKAWYLRSYARQR